MGGMTTNDAKSTDEADRAHWTREILEHVPTAVLGVAADGTIEYANAHAAALLHAARGTVAGRHSADVLPGLDLFGLARSSPPLYDSAHPVLARRFDASTFAADLTITEVVRPNGQYGLVLVLHDASERLAAVDAYQRAAVGRQNAQSQRLEALGQLVSGVTHDFNNLLGVIQNFAVLAQRGVAEGSRAATDLEEIQHAAQRAFQLTGQLLGFARGSEFAPTTIDLNSTVSTFGQFLRRTLGANIAIVTECDDPELLVTADEAGIEQALLNLALNARDAMPDGGTLRLVVDHTDLPQVPGSTAIHGRVARLRVIDDGHGIPAETMARVFEPFFTTKPDGRGTGLGLSSVRAIVSKMGGEVHIESSDRSGTVVTMLLPIAISDDLAHG